jgi:hypothetical protein
LNVHRQFAQWGAPNHRGGDEVLVDRRHERRDFICVDPAMQSPHSLGTAARRGTHASARLGILDMISLWWTDSDASAKVTGVDLCVLADAANRSSTRHT